MLKARGSKRVYICSPYRADDGQTIEHNVQDAQRYIRFAISQECAPFAGHLMYPGCLGGSEMEGRRDGILCDLNFIHACDELWVFGDWVSDGMLVEIAEATDCGIPVRYFDVLCREKK